jgi:NAD(P)-dependent dehydrogenase (short-subunit alcohol dehydrogenase family)
MRFKGKIAAITGAGSGIGKQTALRFAQEGAQVAVIDVNEENANSVAQELKELGTDPIALDCDVSKAEDVKKSFQEIQQKYKTLDILFSNAGVAKTMPVEELIDEDWAWHINVNLNGTFYCTREALKMMIPKKQGKIILMSSIYGGVSEKGFSVGFAASKAGIVGYAKCLAIQAARYNINVNCVAPGYIVTPIHKGTPAQREEYYNSVKPNISLGRIGHVDDVAFTVLFLASEEASYYTGQTLSMNGGVMQGIVA